MLTLNFMSVVQTQIFFDQQKLKRMSSVMPLTFNTVELCVVTINEKSCSRAREVCKALENNKAARQVVIKHCSKENYAHKWQLSSVSAANTIDCSKDSQKLDLCINEEGMIELLV